MSFQLSTGVGVLGLRAFLGHVSAISADETKSFVDPTLLLFGGELAVRAKFAGKVLGVRRIILLTSIILPGVVIPVGIVVGLGSRVVVVGTTGVVVVVIGVVAAVLVR